jgi:hypothetical protein
MHGHLQELKVEGKFNIKNLPPMIFFAFPRRGGGGGGTQIFFLAPPPPPPLHSGLKFKTIGLN